MNEVWLRPTLQHLHVSYLALISYPDGVAINIARCVQSMAPKRVLKDSRLTSGDLP